MDGWQWVIGGTGAVVGAVEFLRFVAAHLARIEYEISWLLTSESAAPDSPSTDAKPSVPAAQCTETRL